MARPDPGPPPADGLVVRPEEQGFYARLQPRPRPPVPVVVAVIVGFGILGTILAVATSSEPVVRAWILGGSVAFGVLLYGLAFGQGFFPVEIRGDDRELSWSGDRIPWDAVGSCVAEGGQLQLRSPDGRVLATVHHLEPAAARWVALAVEASLPE